MGETSFLGPRYANWRAAIALFGVLVVLPAFAAWLNGWSLFSFPLGTFLVALGVPICLIALALMIAQAPDDETFES